MPDPADDLAARIDDERAMAALLDRLDALPTAHREVLTLWVWEKLTYDEIAVALDVPVGTVRPRLSRARARLRKLDGGEIGVGTSVRSAPSTEPVRRCGHPCASRPRGRWAERPAPDDGGGVA